MVYADIQSGKFIKRINRFLAWVEIENQVVEVHVKNTGRCKEILQEGVTVFLEPSKNLNRKTRYSLVSAFKGKLLINIDSQIPNHVIYEGINQKKMEDFQDIAVLKKEKTYGQSRFDLYFERENGQKGFVEIKGVTLENDGIAMFPDAPTLRGTKHLNEMIAAIQEGYEGYVIFLIQIDKINRFQPNDLMDPLFGETLRKAIDAGVNVMVYNSYVTEKGITLANRGTVEIISKS